MSLQPIAEFLEIREKVRRILRLPAIDPKGIVEAILFCANEPVSARKIAEVLDKSEKEISEIIETLNQEYERDNHSFRIHKVLSGYQIYTLPCYSEWIKIFFKEKRKKLSKAAKEVLAIIAFNQPITRPEIEKLRGVDSKSTLSFLLEERLVKTDGRAKRLGAPFLYRTTREFLKYFGLSSLDDLPRKEEIENFFESRDAR